MKNAEAAENWIHRMQAMGVAPNERCRQALIHACVKAEKFERAQHWLYSDVVPNSTPTAESYAHVVHAHAKGGNFEEAEKTIQTMVSTVRPGTGQVAFNVLIDACAKRGDLHGAEAWIGRMMKAAIAPD